mmetsp:Transcript_9225/g.30797  ORF Transcript_9225/g.30797 Transcript_9225/m.30797 type:complete len:224 (+) Transcript_9225:98-769(+)
MLRTNVALASSRACWRSAMQEQDFFEFTRLLINLSVPLIPTRPKPRRIALVSCSMSPPGSLASIPYLLDLSLEQLTMAESFPASLRNLLVVEDDLLLVCLQDLHCFCSISLHRLPLQSPLMLHLILEVGDPAVSRLLLHSLILLALLIHFLLVVLAALVCFHLILISLLLSQRLKLPRLLLVLHLQLFLGFKRQLPLVLSFLQHLLVFFRRLDIQQDLLLQLP